MTTISTTGVALDISVGQATINSPVAFEFPTIDGFSAKWNLDPLDKIFFQETNSANAVTTWALNDGSLVQNSNPVQLDRYGTVPSLFLDSGDVVVTLANQYGVEKYKISRYSGTWGLHTSIKCQPVALQITTNQAVILNRIQTTSVSLTITTNTATITSEAASSGTALHSEGNVAMTLEDDTAIILET